MLLPRLTHPHRLTPAPPPHADCCQLLLSSRPQQARSTALILLSTLVALQKRYVDEFLKVLPAKAVGRFFQVESRLNKLIDLEVSSQIPLVR